MSLADIIVSIAETSSTNEKQAILERNKTNKYLEKTFLFAENPRYNYYIRYNETVTGGSGTKSIGEKEFQFLLDLNARKITGNDARRAFEVLLQDLTDGDRVILVRILNRDLRCGIGTTVANKVWKDLIPEYPVMLASKGDKKAFDYLEKHGGPYIVQCKCDGGRVNVIIDNDGNVTYHSRNGSTLDLHGFFDKQFQRFKNKVFDGELLARDSSGIVNRQTGNGLYTKAVRGTLPKAEVAQMCMVVWDIIDLDDFNNGISHITYEDRLTYLLNINGFNPSLVSVVESEKISNLDDANTFYDRMRARGEEGAIIKTADSVWEDRRSKNMVKLKASETADLLCIGVESGKGKYANMIGNLICTTSDGLLKVGVGTGLKDEDRAKDPSEFISKIVEVGYNAIIRSKNKSEASLFLPVYKQVRLDKNTANSLDELK